MTDTKAVSEGGVDFDVVPCSYCGGIGSDQHGYCRQCGGTGFEQQQRQPQDDTERCIACALALEPGELVLDDASGGLIHAACCGPERESYCNADGDPIGPNDPIPTGWPWQPALAVPMGGKDGR